METAKLKKQLTAEDFSFSATAAAVPLCLFTAGVYAELQFSIFLGLPIIIAGLFFTQPFLPAGGCLDLVPKFSGGPKWTAATATEITRLKEKLEALKNRSTRWDNDLALFLTIGTFILFWALPVVYEFFPLRDLERYFYFVLPNLFVFSLAYYLWTAPSTWAPENIIFKLPVLEKLKGLLPTLGAGNWQREYQLELKDSDQGPVPTDIKLLLKPPECPPDFLGIQGQVSKNQGQPYVYFVVLTRLALPIVQPRPEELKKPGIAAQFVNLFKAVLFPTNPDVFEKKTDKEVNILVIRQYADKHGGYITTDADQERLLQLALLSAKMTCTPKKEVSK